MEAILARIESFPQQSQNLLVWLKTILEVHYDYLMTMPGFGEKVEMLRMMMERNTSNLESLQRIQSKVELLVSLSDLGLKRKFGLNTHFSQNLKEGMESKGYKKKEENERNRMSTTTMGENLGELEKSGFYCRKMVKLEKPMMVHEEGEKVEEETLAEEEKESEVKGFEDSIMGSEEELEKDFDNAMKPTVRI